MSNDFLGYKEHTARVYQPKPETTAFVAPPQLVLDWQCGGLGTLLSVFIWSLRQLLSPFVYNCVGTK